MKLPIRKVMTERANTEIILTAKPANHKLRLSGVYGCNKYLGSKILIIS